MISVIMPLGQRQRSSIFWIMRGTAYIVASTVAGALVGALVGGGGAWLRALVPLPVVLIAVILLAVAYALHESGLLRLPHPENAWQVPNEWIVRWPILGAVVFGLALGAGIFTFIPFTSFYLLLAWELLVANPLAGALLGAAYGLARGLPVVIGAIATQRGQPIASVHLSILNASLPIHRATAGLLVLLAAGLTIPLLIGL